MANNEQKNETTETKTVTVNVEGTSYQVQVTMNCTILGSAEFDEKAKQALLGHILEVDVGKVRTSGLRLSQQGNLTSMSGVKSNATVGAIKTDVPKTTSSAKKRNQDAAARLFAPEANV